METPTLDEVRNQSSSDIRPTPPNRSLMTVANRFIRLLLRSPFHGLLSGTLLLLTYIGRKSGKRYTIPVSYVDDGDVVTILSYRTRIWWKQLKANPAVVVEIRGRRFEGLAEVIDDDQTAIVAGLLAHLQAHPLLANGYHIPLDAAGHPDPEAMRQAAQFVVLVRIRIALVSENVSPSSVAVSAAWR